MMGGRAYWTCTSIVGFKAPCPSIERTLYFVAGVALIYLAYRTLRHIDDSHDVEEWMGILSIVVAILLPAIVCIVFAFGYGS